MRDTASDVSRNVAGERNEAASRAPELCVAAFELERAYIRQILRRFGTARCDLEDLSQEVFVVLSRRWDNYDSSRPLRPYLFGIASRLALAHRRKHPRELLSENIEVDDEGAGPEDALSAKQARAMIRAALEGIPRRRRAVWVMHELDHVPVSEVAAALSIPVFTAYSRLRKARRELEAAARRIARVSENGS